MPASRNDQPNSGGLEIPQTAVQSREFRGRILRRFAPPVRRLTAFRSIGVDASFINAILERYRFRRDHYRNLPLLLALLRRWLPMDMALAFGPSGRRVDRPAAASRFTERA